jgi:hypothetical protein
MGSQVGSRLFEATQFGLEVRDHAATIRAAPDARRRFENLQFASDPVDGFVQLLAKGFF